MSLFKKITCEFTDAEATIIGVVVMDTPCVCDVTKGCLCIYCSAKRSLERQWPEVWQRLLDNKKERERVGAANG